MLTKTLLATALLLGLVVSCIAQEAPDSKPVELELLNASIGDWDALIEIWPAGPDSPSSIITGVETNRPFGEYWIASDFDSEFMGQNINVHSIIGYDLDQQKLVGTVIDQGPYAAKMIGEYDKASQTVRWLTEAKAPGGEPMVQQTVVTQKRADERVLVLSVPGEKEGEFTKFMQIRFTKRKVKRSRLGPPNRDQ
jgi:hypothetical protein